MPRAGPSGAVFRRTMRARAEHLFVRTITRPAVPFRLPMPARRNPDTHVPARRAYRPPRRYPSHSRTPYAPGASRFLATSRRQRRGQRRAVGAGRPERRNRPTSKGYRVRVSSVVDDAPHHTPAAPGLDEPQPAVRPRDNRHSPVAHTTHLSPTNARICATSACNAAT